MTIQTSAPASGGGQGSEAPLDWRERNLLSQVDPCLRDGVTLFQWWQKADRTRSFAKTMHLVEVPNRPEEGYSFFDRVELEPGRVMPVMGDVPTLFYDRPKGREAARWCREVERFALRYFLRIADQRLPQAVPDKDRGMGPLDFLGWCTRSFERREGFGFQQLYYKRRGDATIYRFPKARRTAIIDTRELLTKYEWVVGKVKIFDFDLAFPQDPSLPQVSVPLDEEQFIILSSDFVTDAPEPYAGDGGSFSFGYAMLRPAVDPSILAYGPGQFQAGFQVFDFLVAQEGRVGVRMPFVVNRPDRILDLSLDPFDWFLDFLYLLTKSRAGRFIEPIEEALDQLPFRHRGFDPIFTGIRLLNIATLGLAARQLCISREQLEKLFLIFHFKQYYSMLVGTLQTWRQIADWLAPEQDLPRWVVDGGSS